MGNLQLNPANAPLELLAMKNILPPVGIIDYVIKGLEHNDFWFNIEPKCWYLPFTDDLVYERSLKSYSDPKTEADIPRMKFPYQRFLPDHGLDCNNFPMGLHQSSAAAVAAGCAGLASFAF